MTNRVSGIIEIILARNVEARDSDNVLIVEYLQGWQNANFTPHQIELLKDVNFESITRCRRKLQEEGKFLPSERVARQRRLKSMIVQQRMPKTKSEKVPELISDQPKAVPWND